jgi:hypothetical protein
MKDLSFKNWHTNTIANCLVVRVWAWNTFHVCNFWCQCAKVPPNHLDGIWLSLLRFIGSMGNHKSINKIGLNTMVITIEKTCIQKRSHLEAFMFHHRWCPSRMSCNQVQHTIYLPCPILFCVILLLGCFFSFNVFSIFSHGYGCGCIFLLFVCLCFSISNWKFIILLLMDDNFFCSHVWKEENVPMYFVCMACFENLE